MTFPEFMASLKNPQPPGGLTDLLLAMWHDGKGDWNTAHQVAQDVDTKEGAWVHAYLHRKEGDQSNALYWYQRANLPMAKISLDEEWKVIVKKLMS